MINHFWNCWVKEHLLELRNAPRYPNTQHQSQPAAQVGDMVVIHDSDLPRGFWKIARIVRLIIGIPGGNTQGSGKRRTSHDTTATATVTVSIGGSHQLL